MPTQKEVLPYSDQSSWKHYQLEFSGLDKNIYNSKADVDSWKFKRMKIRSKRSSKIRITAEDSKRDSSPFRIKKNRSKKHLAEKL